MARMLVLMDENGPTSEPTGDSATLSDDGRHVSFQGDGVKDIISRWLVGHSPQEVFDKMAGWSNGYVSLQEKEE